MSREKAEAQVREDIAEYGWHVIKVLPEGPHQPHTYSIGLFETFGHPEITIVGLRGETAHTFIANIVDEIRAGRTFEAGHEYADIAASFSVAFVAVPQAVFSEYFGWALWYYGSPMFPVLQMVWQDRQGLFPWQLGFAEDLVAVQPVLAGVQLCAAPDLEPQLASSRVRYYSACGSKPVSLDPLGGRKFARSATLGTRSPGANYALIRLVLPAILSVRWRKADYLWAARSTSARQCLAERRLGGAALCLMRVRDADSVSAWKFPVIVDPDTEKVLLKCCALPIGCIWMVEPETVPDTANDALPLSTHMHWPSSGFLWSLQICGKVIAPAKFEPFCAMARVDCPLVLKGAGVPFAHDWGEVSSQENVSLTAPDHQPVMSPSAGRLNFALIRVKDADSVSAWKLPVIVDPDTDKVLLKLGTIGCKLIVKPEMVPDTANDMLPLSTHMHWPSSGFLWSLQLCGKVIEPAKFEPFCAITRVACSLVLKGAGVPFAHGLGELTSQKNVSLTGPDHQPVISP